MFTDQHLSKLFSTPGVSFHAFKHFMSDKRLASPFAICTHQDAMQRFGEYETYPDELSEVFYYNGF